MLREKEYQDQNISLIIIRLSFPIVGKHRKRIVQSLEHALRIAVYFQEAKHENQHIPGGFQVPPRGVDRYSSFRRTTGTGPVEGRPTQFCHYSRR
jgi:hypothetical protein